MGKKQHVVSERAPAKKKFGAKRKKGKKGGGKSSTQEPTKMDQVKPNDVSEQKTKGSEVKQKSPSEASKHKKSLEELKDKDPEFYEFLRKEDSGLLDFDESDDGEYTESGSDDSDDGAHRHPEKLEVASDDSNVDSSDEEENEKQQTKKRKRASSQLVTMAMINRWSRDMRENTSAHAVHSAVQAFKAAVVSVGNEDADPSLTYAVEGSAIFNAIVRLCMTDILPTVNRILKLPSKSKDPNKPVLPQSSKYWSKVRGDMKTYLADIIQLLTNVAEPAIQSVVLKHVHQLVPYCVGFPKISKFILKRLVLIWSTGEETSRVLAFLSISKITRHLQSSMLEFVVKQMYMAYVKNVKFTSPTTLPNINFMQRSLVEIFALDAQLTYQYAFVYIRQLAIHLRNAITTKKKETCQAVYNWQFIHSVNLWVKMLSILHLNEVLEPLIYPLTQVIIGTIKLIPTAKFYPLRFHCVRALNTLSEATGVFIPTLPFILEIFELTDFNKKHKSISMKPFNFAVILKLSNAQLQEKVFRDGLIDQMHELLMEQFHIHAHCVGFPELVVPAVVQMKQFVKRCKVSNHTKQIKQISDKVEETSRTILQRRKAANLSLSDSKAIDAWEKRSKEEGTPLGKFYVSWRKLRDRELQHEISGKERLSHDWVPVMERRVGRRAATDDEKREFADIFESDSDESDDETRFLLKDERPAKKRKVDKVTGGDTEQFSDFDEDELEQLAGSAAEDDSEPDEEEGQMEDEEREDDSKVKNKAREGAREFSEDDSDEDIVEDFTWSD